MGALLINTDELSALMGLPYIQQVAYLLGIRPYMDNKTGIVGVKRGISYQSLSETLYIEPHPGIASGSPSREQVRRVVKSLERAGLIGIQSTEKHLILKCLLLGFMKNPHRRIPAAQTAGPIYGVPIVVINQTQSGIQAANES